MSKPLNQAAAISKKPTPPSEWEQRYWRSVISFFVRHGTPMPVDPDPWDNGEAPAAISIRDHFISCGINWKNSTMVEETNWTIWGGTGGNDTWEFGYKVNVTCKCGNYVRYPFSNRGITMAELINGITGVEELG